LPEDSVLYAVGHLRASRSLQCTTGPLGPTSGIARQGPVCAARPGFGPARGTTGPLGPTSSIARQGPVCAARPGFGPESWRPPQDGGGV